MGCLKLERLEQEWTPLKVIHKAERTPKNRHVNYYPFGAEHSTSLTGDYAWRKLGGEKETALDLGLYNHPFRQYDPLIGQWTGPDMLSEWTPELSPYHYSNNNPVNFIDPLGLFATRAEARAYRRDNDISGRIRKNKDTGRFEIKSKGSDGLITQLEDGSIDLSVSATFTGASVKAKPETRLEKFRDANFVSGFVFDVFNNSSITLQTMNPFDFQVQQLTGEIVTTGAAKQDALIGTTGTFVPLGRGVFLKSLVPKSVILPKLSAPQFSSLFKGTFVPRLAPATRGKLNRVLNFGTQKGRGMFETGGGEILLSRGVNKIIEKE